MEIIKIKNVFKKFGVNTILKDISFSINKGEIVSIIGPSGAGKTTLLRAMSQLEKIDEGSINICGSVMVENGIYSNKKILRDIKLNCGLVFQDYELFPHLSAIENIALAPILVLKKGKNEAYGEGRELLKKVSLLEKEKFYPFELSGGQKQRIAIARALATNPKVLYFDEPTSALDIETTNEVGKLIKGLSMGDITIVIVTHDIKLAKDISDRVIFIEKGEVVEENDKVSFFSTPKNLRTKNFIGSNN